MLVRLPNPRVRRSTELLAILGVLALALVSSCSSPTGPTPPPVTAPTAAHATADHRRAVDDFVSRQCHAHGRDEPGQRDVCRANDHRGRPAGAGDAAPGSPDRHSRPAPRRCSARRPTRPRPRCRVSSRSPSTSPRRASRGRDSSRSVTASPPARLRPRPASRASGAPNYRLIIVPTASYPTQLLSMLRARYTDQASALSMVNSGAPGEWAQDGAQRLPGVLIAQRPEAVLLLEGYNDLGASGTTGINSAWTAIDRMAKEIRNRGARVFLSTLPPPRPNGAKSIPASQVIALNDRIRQTAAGEGAVLVDAYAATLRRRPALRRRRRLAPHGSRLPEAGRAVLQRHPHRSRSALGSRGMSGARGPRHPVDADFRRSRRRQPSLAHARRRRDRRAARPERRRQDDDAADAGRADPAVARRGRPAGTSAHRRRPPTRFASTSACSPKRPASGIG